MSGFKKLKGDVEPVFAVNIVDMDAKPGEVPDSERIDEERTLAAREALSKNLRKAEALQSMGGIFLPTPGQVRTVEAMRPDTLPELGICGQCVHCDFRGGQEKLEDGLDKQIVEGLGGPRPASRLGDLRAYGWCEARGMLVEWRGPRCEEWRDKSKVMGRLIGGMWKIIGGFGR